LRRVVHPAIFTVREVRLRLDITAEIAAPDIAEIPERPDSVHRPISRSQAIVGQQFVLLRHGRLLETEAACRTPAADDGGQYDGDINLRFFIECGPTAGDPPIKSYDRDTIDPSNQTSHHALQQLTQRTLHNSFRTTTTIQPMADVLKKG
jgi:hypothetical protein